MINILGMNTISNSYRPEVIKLGHSHVPVTIRESNNLTDIINNIKETIMSYSNSATSIIAGPGIVVSPVSGTGIDTITISASGTQNISTRVAITSPVAVTNNDDFISIQVPGNIPVAVTLPTTPTVGEILIIKDGLGLASQHNPIIITPAAGFIDGSATAHINSPYGSLNLIYTGSAWNLV